MPSDIQLAEVVEETSLTPEQAKRNRLANVESEVIGRNLEVFHDAAHFADLDFECEDPAAYHQALIDQWVKELGSYKEAMRRFRTAKYALMSAKEAPVALQMAKGIVTASVKRAAGSVNIANLNVAKVVIVGNAPVYPEKEVER